MTIIRKLWSGAYSLPVAFWGFYVVGILVTVAAGGIISFASGYLEVYWITLIAIWLYGVVASVGVWRSAGASLKSPVLLTKMWGYGARLIVLVAIARALFALYVGVAFLFAKYA